MMMQMVQETVTKATEKVGTAGPGSDDQEAEAEAEGPVVPSPAQEPEKVLREFFSLQFEFVRARFCCLGGCRLCSRH